MKAKHVFIQPETDAALSKLGGKTRAENIRRAVALAEVAGELAFWLRQAAIETVSQETEDGIYEALAKYKEAKQ